MIDNWVNTKWHWFANFGPAVISAILIVIFGAIYEALAKALTNFENHKSERSYETSLISKVFVFQFINFMNVLFYIAFIK